MSLFHNLVRWTLPEILNFIIDFLRYNEHYLPQVLIRLISINTSVNCCLFLKGAWNVYDHQPELELLIVVMKIVQ